MISITTNFTLKELEHMNSWIQDFEPCKYCDSARRKITEAIELATIATEAKGIQEETMR
jgi:GTP cyclohydrolase III